VICGAGWGAGKVGSGAAGVISGGGFDGGACSGGVVTSGACSGGVVTVAGAVGATLDSVDRTVGGAVVDGGAVSVCG